MATEEAKRGRPQQKQAEQVPAAASTPVEQLVEEMREDRGKKQLFKYSHKPFEGEQAKDMESATDADVRSLVAEATNDAVANGHELGPWYYGVPADNELPPKMPNATYRGASCIHCSRGVHVKFCPPIGRDPSRKMNMHKLVTPHKSGAALRDICDRVRQDQSKFSATRDPRILQG